MTGRMRVGLLITLVMILLDQLSKWLAIRELSQHGLTLLPGYFDLVLVHNVGAAFGLFTGFDPEIRLIFLCSVAVLAVVIILIMLKKATTWIHVIGLGTVLGGALGNLVDRVRFGWVVDFIHLHWHELSWPVFNLADSAISVGVGLLLYDHLFASDPAET